MRPQAPRATTRSHSVRSTTACSGSWRIISGGVRSSESEPSLLSSCHSRFRGNDGPGMLPAWLPAPSPLPSFGAMLSTYRVLLTGYFGLGAAIILWNIAAATLILRGRRSPSVSTLATSLAALLLVPGLVVTVSDASLVYGRAIQHVAWLWPL